MDFEPLTWTKVVELEPRLADLEGDVASVSPDAFRREGFDRVWVFPFKLRMVELVGWERRPIHPILSSSIAYDVAMDHLLSILEALWKQAA